MKQQDLGLNLSTRSTRKEVLLDEMPMVPSCIGLTSDWGGCLAKPFVRVQRISSGLTSNHKAVQASMQANAVRI
jgi:hypothetical protein